jgi:hypothetical protein
MQSIQVQKCHMFLSINDFKLGVGSGGEAWEGYWNEVGSIYGLAFECLLD